MATTSIADKLAKLEKKIAKRQATIAEEQTQLDKELAEYDKLYLTALANKYKLSGKDLFSAIEREHEQLEKLREGEQSDDDADIPRSRTMRTSRTILRSSTAVFPIATQAVIDGKGALNE